MARVLILCPTYDHADTLFASTASVRVQTFTDWELVVIGDGAPPRTARIMSALARDDSRIRYEPHLKSKRIGEVYRDAVIRNSEAEFVLQLGDDDLWAPDHIERMLDALGDADWANQAPLRIYRDGRADWNPVNHGTPRMRAAITSGVPVSAGPNYVAYRRAAYLRLPEGWTSAPSNGPSDAFMWGKFFRYPGLRVASTAETSALKFPSHVSGREDFDSTQRLAELQPWLARMGQPGFIRSVCAGASIRSRMLSLYRIHMVSSADSWEAALRLCGFEPHAGNEPCRRARNGESMSLPLTTRQQEEAAVALEEYRRELAG